MQPITLPQGPNMSLFGLERELIELMQYRDDLAAELCYSEAQQTEQAAALQAVDAQIGEYIKRQAIARADSITAAIRECNGRAGTLDQEIVRLSALRDAWRAREAAIKERAAEALAATLDPQVIAGAKQNQILKRIEGRLGQLKLCKSAPSVDVTDAALLPADMQVIKLTMSLSDWRRIEVMLAEAGLRDVSCSGQEPKRSWIAAKLKSGQSVAGARLVEDNVHIRLS